MSLRTVFPVLCLLSFGLTTFTSAQMVSTFPYTQNFDSVAPPVLPPGWSSSQNRSPGTNDFTTAGSAHSSPNAVLSTNATISQSLSTPLFDFRNQVPDRITFFTRRSATHLARVVVEASQDSGRTFTLQVGDTLTNTSPNIYVQASFVIPSSLAHRSGVVFRWRIIPDAGGNTGTFRIDDVEVTAQTQHDLAVGGLRFSPSLVAEGDTAYAVASIRNAGLQQAESFEVRFYIDHNSDSIPQPDEFVVSMTNPHALEVGDSLDVAASLGVFPAGDTCVIAQIFYALDQNPLNDRRIALLHVGYPGRSVVVNEIMYAPTGTEPEWIELYNKREENIDLRDWMVSDDNVAVRKLIASSHVIIPRSGYVVLTKDSAALIDVHPSIPARVINVTGLPTLNNSGDAVVLYDNRGATMDSVAYLPSWGGNSGGRSLERIDPSGGSTVQTNWASSRDVGRSTPGLRNSVSRKDYDLVADTLLLDPAVPVHGDSLVVSLNVRNAGFQQVPSCILRLYEDRDNDSLPEPGELLCSLEPSVPIAPLDSCVCVFAPFIPRGNDLTLLGVISCARDEDTTNNRTLLQTKVGYRRGSVAINELMYSPAEEPEWLELYNNVADTIDVKGWKVSNRLTATRHLITSGSVLIPPGRYAVIVKDTLQLLQRYMHLPGVLVQASAMPTYLFNNTGDAAVVFDNCDHEMDSMRYVPAWGGSTGTSLERIDVWEASCDSLNWASSTDSLKATPGRENSVAALDCDLRALPGMPLVSPPSTPLMLSLTVRNIGRLPAGEFDAAFFDDGNRDSVASPEELIGRVHVTQPLLRGDTLRVSTRWLDPPSGARLIIARVEYAPDMRQGNNSTIIDARIGYPPGAVVINEIMYAPFTGEAEYVELYNGSSSDVDLTGWKLSDRPAPSGSCNEFLVKPAGRRLHSGEFCVIASDSSIFSRFRYLDTLQHGMVLVLNQSSLGLNNDGDAVVIRDASRVSIDSVAYVPAWHNPAVTDATGRSLERIRPGLGSNDPRNWSSCAFVIGGTPGAPNSILASTLSSQAKFSCSPNPFSPDGDGREDFCVIHYELPVEVASVSVMIFDIRGRLIRRLVNSEPSGSHKDIVWDGYDDDRQRARVGLYIVLVEGLDEKGGSVSTAKGVVVVAARL